MVRDFYVRKRRNDLVVEGQEFPLSKDPLFGVVVIDWGL